MTNEGLGFARVVEDKPYYAVYLGDFCVWSWAGSDAKPGCEIMVAGINASLQKHFVPVELADKMADAIIRYQKWWEDRPAIMGGQGYFEAVHKREAESVAIRAEFSAALSAYQNRGRGSV